MYPVSVILDFFFPRYCLMCGNRLLIEEKTICLHCNFELPRTFLWNNPTENNLAKRYWGKVPINKAAAYLTFQSQSETANIIYAFKYKGEPYTAVYMGEMMAKEIHPSGFFTGIDYLIPVPITGKRERKRGYNQSEKLAIGIKNVLHIPVITNAIRRKKNSISQTKLERHDRPDNIKNVFEATPKAKKLAGKHCLLIDDVITTGSTTSECAKEILQIPNTTVSILSLGYVKETK